MKKKCNIVKLKSGMEDEYKRRHDNIWPELRAHMTRRGVRNYSIWHYENMIFSYYELDEAAAVPLTEEEWELDKYWEAYMKDIIEIVPDPDCIFLSE